MRSALVRVALATTSMVALAFLVPLALVARELAYDRALSDARQQATAVIAALAISQDRSAVTRAVVATAAGSSGRIGVHLPGEAAVGTGRAGQEDLNLVVERRQAAIADVPGGLAYLQPTAIHNGRIAVVEVFVPAAELRRGVPAAWMAMTAVAVVLVVGSVAVADRLGGRIVAATHNLADAARRFGAGDLSARARLAGPLELAQAGAAFNAMADRVVVLVDAERELAADLSHRLRTPLTALRLDAETASGPAGGRIRRAVEVLAQEIDEIIRDRRRPVAERASERVDLADVVADRLAFWAVLAEDHGRQWSASQIPEHLWVRAPRGDLVAAVDALLGNVFQHTPQGTPFRVSVLDEGLMVEDAGPGIGDPQAALRRGGSGTGSTGLGLDIVRRVASSSGGTVHIGQSDLGGARVTMTVKAGA